MSCESLQQSKGFVEYLIKIVMPICIAFAELVAFMEDLQKEDIAPVTYLAHIYKTDQLEQLGARC